MDTINLQKTKYGVDNCVYYIKKKKKIQHVLKIYSKRSQAEVRKLIKINQLLLIKNYPVPKILHALTFKNHPAVLMEFIKGKHLDLNNKNRIESVADAMATLHKLNFGKKINNYYFQHKEYTKLFNACKKWPPTNIIKSIYKKIDTSYLNFLPKGTIHGDFSNSNILFDDKNNIVGILDFDHCCNSYLLTDLVRSLIFFAFDKNKLNRARVDKIIYHYNLKRSLNTPERDYFYTHMQLILIKIILETYYYEKVLSVVKVKNYKYNQTYFKLFKKLLNIKNKKRLNN